MPVPTSFWPVLHQIHAALCSVDALWVITGSTSFALRGLPFTPTTSICKRTPLARTPWSRRYGRL